MSHQETARTPAPSHLREAAPTASQKQLDYIRDLMEQRDIVDLSGEKQTALNQPDEFWQEETTRLSKAKASRIIDTLLKLPYTPRQSKESIKANYNLPDVPNGRYAVTVDDDSLMFYSIKKGNYTTFVDVWASDARWPVKNASKKLRILTAILADPDAGPRFGREIGKCYVCGRTLTDETSRALGIGPVCRGEQ